MNNLEKYKQEKYGQISRFERVPLDVFGELKRLRLHPMHDEMRSSAMLCGAVPTVVAQKTPAGKYVCLANPDAISISFEVGLYEVSSVVVTDASKRSAVCASVLPRNMKFTEAVYQAVSMYTAGFSVEEMAEALDVSPGLAGRIMRIVALPKEILFAVIAGRITQRDAVALTAASDAVKESVIERLYDEEDGALPKGFIRQLIEDGKASQVSLLDEVGKPYFSDYAVHIYEVVLTVTLPDGGEKTIKIPVEEAMKYEAQARY